MPFKPLGENPKVRFVSRALGNSSHLRQNQQLYLHVKNWPPPPIAAGVTCVPKLPSQPQFTTSAVVRAGTRH